MKIALQNISKSFGAFKAVDAVSLEAGDGECFFLLGPSGCGKTTVLRMIAGFCAPDSGTILFDRIKVNGLAAHLRNAGMVFQNYALWPHLSVEENIAFGLTVKAHRVPKTERIERVREMVALLRLEGTEKRMPGQLSGGQQQRVALARALIVKPACLLLDEPLSNLDAKLRMEMRLEIRHLIKKLGITAVYVTHDQAEALAMADRCAIMRAGRLEQVGTPRELYEQPASRFIADFMGYTNLFDARVVSRDSGSVRLSSPAGNWISEASGGLSSIAQRATEDPVQAKEDAKVAVAVRPEKVRLGDWPADAPNVFSGRLKESIYLGAAVECRVELKGGLVITALQAGLSPDVGPGKEVRVRADPRDVVVLPREEG